MKSRIFAPENIKQSIMKGLQLTEKELNVLLFALNTRLQSIRGFNSYEEEHLENIKNKIIELQQ